MRQLRGKCIVLTLHRIVPDAAVGTCRSPRGMVLRESLFTALLDYLQETVDVVSPLDLLRRGEPGSMPRVLITFDDGWLDNYTVARGHLLRRNMRACFFVSTALLGRPQPFWPERCVGLLRCAVRNGRTDALQHLLACSAAEALRAQARPENEEHLLNILKRYPATAIEEKIAEAHARLHISGVPCFDAADAQEQLMSWDQLRELAAEGHAVASHTATHSLLPLAQPEVLDAELRDPLDAFRRELGLQPAWISYPNGDSTEHVRSRARDCGYDLGFTNSPGVWRPEADRFAIPRTNLWDRSVSDRHGTFQPAHADQALYWRALHA